MFFIKVPDMNDSISRVKLADREYYIRFTYNAAFDYWTVGLYDPQMNPVVTSMKVVPMFDMLNYYRQSDHPDGMLYCFTKLDHVGRDDFKNRKAGILFIPLSELHLNRRWR